MDDSLPTTYTVTWTDDRHLHRGDTVQEQTSYTITGLTLDTVYTITVTAANMCGDGPEFRTSIFFSTNTTFTASTIVTTSMTCAVTHPTTTTTAMINTTTTNSMHMTTVFSEDTGITTKATKNLCVTTTTIIKGFSILNNYTYIYIYIYIYIYM